MVPPFKVVSARHLDPVRYLVVEIDPSDIAAVFFMGVITVDDTGCAGEGTGSFASARGQGAVQGYIPMDNTLVACEPAAGGEHR